MAFTGKTDLWWHRITVASLVALGLIIPILVAAQLRREYNGSDILVFDYWGTLELTIITAGLISAVLAVFLKSRIKRVFQILVLLSALFFLWYFIMVFPWVWRVIPWPW